MNTYFRVRIGTAADVERMTVGTAATLVNTQPNPDLTALAGAVNIHGGIGGAERQVLNAPAADPVAKLFIRLLAHRFRHQDAFLAARKAAMRPAAFAGRLDGAQCAEMLRGNVVATAHCIWNVAFPEPRRMMTTTIDEELLVVGWAWAMRLLRDALTVPVPGPDDIPDAAADAKHAETAERHARRAAALLGVLHKRAAAELTARFIKRAPVFCKEYVCRAYQALAVAAVHLARANRAAVLASGSDFDQTIAAELVVAADTLDAGYRILKNEIGADDTGTVLPAYYHNAATAVFAASRFYTARYHVSRPQSLRVLYDHMAAAMALDACAPMREDMRRMADVLATMQDDVALRSSATRFFAALLAPRVVNQDSQTALAVRLREMPALDPPDLDVPQFVPMAPEVLVFQCLCPAAVPAPAPAEERMRRE